MRVIGTAGHVDHGKSTLVAALTGTHPDRLKEEQEREMTIELGFAWMSLPGGETAGIVDVPGHRDFIENMLAGVGGIDAVLFVVAADEGVMPQTREHLAILNILQVQTGVIVLTKIDMIRDMDWLDLVEEDIRTTVLGTVLENAPIVRVSARQGEGIEELKIVLAECLAQRPARPDRGRPRLPIDRAFTIAGFGTVVTGTLSDGKLSVGDEVEILPVKLRARIRGLQTHKKKEEKAVPGSRTAVNLTGVEVDQIQRGYVLSRLGAYEPTLRLDVQFRLAPDASAPVRHNSQVKLFLGASEVVARVRLIGQDEIAPGMEGFLQLELTDPVVAVRGDRYILRRPSPGETLGGGAVIEPHPKRRYKRFAPEVVDRMQALAQGSPSEVLYQASLVAGTAALDELVRQARLSAEEVEPAVKELVENGQVVQLEEGLLTAHSHVLIASQPYWTDLTSKAAAEIKAFHAAYPLRKGMPREALKSRLKLSPRVFQAAVLLWLSNGELMEHGPLLRSPAHSIQFNPLQQRLVDQVTAQFTHAPYSPPSIKEVQAILGDELYNSLVEQGELVPVSNEVVFKRQDYERLRAGIYEHFRSQETLTVIEFRDRYQTSRRYALAFLEHLDSLGITQRLEDVRKLKNSSHQPLTD